MSDPRQRLAGSATAAPSPIAGRLAVALLFAAFAAMRLVHLEADPPAGLDWSAGVFFDEGMLAHEAREQVLFGRPPLDDWSDRFVSPLLAGVKRATFDALGVGLAQVRLVPVAFSLVALALLQRISRRARGAGFAALATALLGFSFTFVMFNRLGLTETSVLAVMMLAAACWLEGWARIDWSTGRGQLTGASLRWLVAAGATTFVSYSWKSYPSFLAVPLAAVLVLTRRGPGAGPRLAPRAAARACGAIALGLGLAWLAWYGLFFVHHAEQIHRAMRFYEHQSLPSSLGRLATNVGDMTFFRVFSRDPVLLYFSFGYLGVLVHRYFRAPGRLDPLDVFFGLWYASHFAFDSILNYQPVRYHVPVIPAMCVLGARAIEDAARGVRIVLPVRVRGMELPLVWAWLALLLAHLPVPLEPIWYRLGGSRGVMLPGSVKLAVWAAVAASILLANLVAARALRARSWALPRALAVPVLAIAPLFWVGWTEGRDYLRWLSEPHYQVRDASRALAARVAPDAWVAGLAAPELALESRIHAIHVYRGFFNDRELFERFPITHLLLDPHQREQSFYYDAYSDQVRNAVLVDAFPVANLNLLLLSLVEPRIDRVELEPADVRAGEGRARVSVEVPARGAAHEVQVGWLPATTQSAPTVASAPMQPAPLSEAIEVAPGVSKEIEIVVPALPAASAQVAVLLPAHRTVLGARWFEHDWGAAEADPMAGSGVAWKTGVAAHHTAHALFGPGLELGPGWLRVSFRLRAGAAVAHGPLARIDLARTGGRGVLTFQELTSAELPANAPYSDHDLAYVLREPESLELRVLTFARSDLYVDRVTVEYAPGAIATPGARAADAGA